MFWFCVHPSSHFSEMIHARIFRNAHAPSITFFATKTQRRRIVFFHLLKWSSEISFLLIFSLISLLTLPSSFFAGLINRHDGLCQKSGLWSLIVIKAGVLAIHSKRSSRLMSSAMFFASKFIDVYNLGGTFFYGFVTLSWENCQSCNKLVFWFFLQSVIYILLCFSISSII